MTKHDYDRMIKAQNCDHDDLGSLADAIRGLQSTDDPSLNALHDELMAIFVEKRTELAREIEQAMVRAKEGE